MVIESYLPPNKTDDAECFFRTESDIKQSQQRQLKLHRTKSLGRPFECSSKVLSMIPSHIPHALWITESGFLARLIQFPDIAKSESESGKKPVVLKTLRGHQGPVTCIQWFWLDGRVKIATGSWDKTIRIWDYEVILKPCAYLLIILEWRMRESHQGRPRGLYQMSRCYGLHLRNTIQILSYRHRHHHYRNSYPPYCPLLWVIRQNDPCMGRGIGNLLGQIGRSSTRC